MRVELSTISPMTITDIYDFTAMKLGHDYNKCRYDCRKIEVAPSIADAVEEYYKRKFSDYKQQFGMDWVCYGPKVNESLPKDTVEIEEGFIIAC